MRKFILILFVLGGCAQTPVLSVFTPHKIDIQQGNFVTQEMVAKLKPGMARSQVRFILGTPLVVDAFRTDRWDYVYLFSKGGGVAEQRRLSVFFKDDALLRLEGDVIPARTGGAPEGARAEKPKPDAAQQKPETAATLKPDPTKADAAGAGAGASGSGDKAAGEQAKPERGFFGRMLDRLGF